MKQIVLVFSLPPKELSPNGRYHWRRKAEKTKAYRLACGIDALRKLGRDDPPKWRTATVEATFYLPSRRGLRSDQDNRIASMKAAMDAVVDVGILADDQGVTWKPVAVLAEPELPRLQLRIVPGAPLSHPASPVSAEKK